MGTAGVFFASIHYASRYGCGQSLPIVVVDRRDSAITDRVRHSTNVSTTKQAMFGKYNRVCRRFDARRRTCRFIDVVHLAVHPERAGDSARTSRQCTFGSLAAGSMAFAQDSAITFSVRLAFATARRQSATSTWCTDLVREMRGDNCPLARRENQPISGHHRRQRTLPFFLSDARRVRHTYLISNCFVGT